MAGAPATVAEDVFAVGALLYQLLTGARIRSASEMTRLLRGKIPDERPVPVSQRAAQQGLLSHKVRKLVRAHRWEAALASLQESEALLRADSPVDYCNMLYRGGCLRQFRDGQWFVGERGGES